MTSQGITCAPLSAPAKRINRDFGNWLAGFIDGEGSFGLYKRSPSRHTNADTTLFRFFLKLRDDDSAILLECHSQIGGTIRYEDKFHDKWGAQIIWSVASRSDCLSLIEILDRHPLRAKKRRDYELWRRAVMLSKNLEFGTGNAKAKAANAHIWMEMAEIREALHKIKEYRRDDSRL